MSTDLKAGPLWDWMEARHAIWTKRARGEKAPWTTDPILQTYRFCNVFRELDTVTQWIHRHIRHPYAQHPNLWMMLAIARQINHPPTLLELMEPDWKGIGHDPEPPKRKDGFLSQAWPVADWDVDRQEYAAGIMDDRKARGEQVYTGAYMIRAESDPKKVWYSWSKQRYLTRIVLGRVWEARDGFLRLWNLCAMCGGDLRAADSGTLSYCANCKKVRAPMDVTLQQVHKWFTQFHGWGGFMAYEVVTDLRHTRYLRNAPDIMTWANAGPGALRGLNRLAGRPLNYPLKQDQACQEMQYLLALAPRFLPKSFPKLEMRDIEHSLCETDKYLRVQSGEGKPRSKYKGGV